jgi:hypothetical protein
MDIGFFVGQQGNDPRATTPGNICSVATFPKTPSPWIDVDGDACGDFLGGGNQITTVNEIKVLCAGDTATGNLTMPYVVTYWQNNGNVCTGPANVTNGAPSKCNAGTGSVSGLIPVSVATYVDVTKATLPTGNITQSFTYTATGPVGSKVGALINGVFTPDNSPGNQPTNTVTISIKGGQTVRFFLNATTAGQTLTITEATTPGWEATANAISCSPVTGNPPITTNLANRSIAATLSLANAAASCTLTNQQSAKITLAKAVGGRVNSGDQFTVSASGGGTLQGTTSATTVLAATTASTAFFSSPGAALTLADTAAGTTVLANYDTRLTCTNALSGTPGYTTNASLPSNASTASTSITPVAGDDITCTYTNTPKPRISLQKAISAGGGRLANTDQFVLAMTGATPVTTTGTGNAVTSLAASVVGTAGATITLSETAAVTTPATSLANYTTTYACTNSGTGGTVVAPGSGTSFDVTPANNDILACTFTNTRKSATLTLRKTWVSGVNGNTVTVTSAGFLANATSGLSTSTGNNTTTGSAVTVYAGETGTISEAFGVGTSSAYSASLSCSGNTTPLAGSSLTVNALDTAIVCTMTNQKNPQVTLVKAVGGRVAGGDQFTVSASGGGTLQGTTSVTTAGAATSASTTFFSTAGAVLTLTDAAAGTTALSDYDTRLSCTNALSGTPGYTTNASLPTNVSTTSTSITPVLGDLITCTYTNTPKPRISLQKAISAAGGGRVLATDQFVLAMTGATPVTTTGTGNAVTSLAASLVGTAGAAITLSETAAVTTPVTSLANYTTTYACTNSGTGGTVVAPGSGTSFGVTPANNDILACTFTNTRKSSTLTLQKTWVNGGSGDTTTVNSAGFLTNATSGLSTSTGNNTTTGSAVTVYAGETGTISEIFGGGTNGASYTQSLSCSGNTTPLVGSSLTIHSSDTAVICTLTNRQSPRITLLKTVGGRVSTGDQFTVSATGGGTLQGTTSATTAGAATSASTTFFSTSGAVLTLTDAAAGTTVLANYDTRLTCTNALSGTPGYTTNASLPSNASTASTSITPVAGDDITCTYTNTPKPRISLQKAISAGGGRVASTDQFVLAITGATSVTTTGTGNAVTSLAASLVGTAGAAITLSETAAVTTPVTSLANYTTTYACTNSGTGGTVVAPGSGTSFDVTPANNDILACTFTNTRKSATLTLRKTWVSGVNGNTVTVTSAGFLANATSGLSTSTGNNTTTGSAVTVYAGETGTISETFGGGTNGASYTQGLSCSGNATPLSGSNLTVNALDTAIVCTLTNTGPPPSNTFAPNGAQTAQPGSVLFYMHTFYAANDGQVTFALTDSAVPSGWPWSQVLYRDSNCNGTLDASEPQISAPIALTAGQSLCLVVKQFVPAGIASGAQNITTLGATFSYSGVNSALPNALYSVIDVTTVDEYGALTLSKRVSNITQGGPAGITVSALPNDVLQYTLTATNNGSAAVSTLVINDATPAFSTYVSATCPAPLPPVITACNVSMQPGVGSPGSVQWTFSGNLAPGGQLVVRYQVRLNQ